MTLTAADKLEMLTAKYSKMATNEIIEKEAKKEEKQKDPKAAVRNRGKVVFPAESPKVKDDKDHMPINDANQARNAWARAHQYDKVPPWYKGSLKELQEAVKRKVHSTYPSIEFAEKKKSSAVKLSDTILNKYAETEQF